MNDLITSRVMYPFATTWMDYPDNESLAVLIYFMGCVKNCKNCHNVMFKNPKYEKSTKIDLDCIYDDIIETCHKNHTNKLVFSGGDPLSKWNLTLTKLLTVILGDFFGIMIYTAYDIEYVKENNVKGFKFIKCGEYDDTQEQPSQKTNEYLRFASKNQKLYNSYYELISKNGIYTFK